MANEEAASLREINQTLRARLDAEKRSADTMAGLQKQLIAEVERQNSRLETQNRLLERIAYALEKRA